MTKKSIEPTKMPRKRKVVQESTNESAHGDAKNSTPVNTPDTSKTSVGTETGSPPAEKTSSLAATGVDTPPPKKVARGLTINMSTKQLKDGIWLRVLLLANRFRVIRTIDVAVTCFPERPFKAALTASQRAMRGILKASLIKKYRTSRFQTVYGISQAGVDWLDEAGFEAASSVRRVSDMTNPEHRLWLQFIVLTAQARGLKAMTESELLHNLNKDKKVGSTIVQGLLTVNVQKQGKTVSRLLRPDAVIDEDANTDAQTGCAWCEIQISKMGSDRDASFGALVYAMGAKLANGKRLTKVVLFAKTRRIQLRALAVVEGLAKANNPQLLIGSRKHFRKIEEGIYEVWTALECKLNDGRTQLVDTMLGHIIIQLLPIWLPKVRIDASNTHSLVGWFGDNYLPYQRPSGTGDWKVPSSPLLKSLRIG
jgi:hypothetical protein